MSGIWIGAILAAGAAVLYFAVKLVADIVMAGVWLVIALGEFLISPFRSRRKNRH